MAKGTFNYNPDNVCGGPSRRVVTQGPKPSPKPIQAHNTPAQQIVYADYVRSLATRFPMPEGELVAKCTPRGEGKYLGRAAGDELKAIITGKTLVTAPPVETPAESIEDWLRRHKIGAYA